MILELEESVSKKYQSFPDLESKNKLMDRMFYSKTSKATTFGWEHTKAYHDNPKKKKALLRPSIDLKTTELSLLSPRKCQESYNYQITYKMVCAKTKVKRPDSNPKSPPCYGGSGSPLLFRQMVIGITAKIDPTSCGYKPAVFARMWAIYRWIQSTINLPKA